jgi:predicted nucleotidyltransferase
MDRETIIEGLRRGLATADPSVVVAYLFGSVARGQHAGESDIDVAVLFDPPPPARLLGPPSSIHDQLETAVSRRVDLIVLNQASPDLIHRVLRDGVVLYERDPGERIRFEVRARNEYFDIKPYLDEYRRAQTA